MDVLSTTLIAIAAHPENSLSLIVAHTLVTTNDSSAARLPIRESRTPRHRTPQRTLRS
jgi:hypothetical protein